MVHASTFFHSSCTFWCWCIKTVDIKFWKHTQLYYCSAWVHEKNLLTEPYKTQREQWWMETRAAPLGNELRSLWLSPPDLTWRSYREALWLWLHVSLGRRKWWRYPSAFLQMWAGLYIDQKETPMDDRCAISKQQVVLINWAQLHLCTKKKPQKTVGSLCGPMFAWCTPHTSLVQKHLVSPTPSTPGRPFPSLPSTALLKTSLRRHHTEETRFFIYLWRPGEDRPMRAVTFHTKNLYCFVPCSGKREMLCGSVLHEHGQRDRVWTAGVWIQRGRPVLLVSRIYRQIRWVHQVSFSSFSGSMALLLWCLPGGQVRARHLRDRPT